MKMSVEEYLAARAAYESVSSEVRLVSAFISDVGGALSRSPGQFIFANCQMALPMEASMGQGSKSADANEWPTVEKIMNLLSRWHALRADFQNKWQAVPHAMRSGMRDPSDLIRQ